MCLPPGRVGLGGSEPGVDTEFQQVGGRGSEDGPASFTGPGPGAAPARGCPAPRPSLGLSGTGALSAGPGLRHVAS